MKVNVPLNRKPRIEMLPLIDIVFLLLVVFIYAMLSMAVHRGLPVLLPNSSTTRIDPTPLLSVTAKADGTVYLNKEPVLLKELKSTLRDRAKGNIDAGVLLFADRRLSYQQLFRVLDEIRLAGLNRISLQAEVNPSP